MTPSARITSNAAQREVVRILALAYGDEKRALEAVARALSESGRAVLPDGSHALFEFVAREMVPALTTDLGPRLTIALLAELEAFRDSSPRASPLPSQPISEAPVTGPRRRSLSEQSFSSAPPQPGRTRTLLVDSDRLRRANLARALLRAKCDMTAVESPSELRTMLASEIVHDIAVVDLGGSNALEILDAFASLAPDLPLIACAPDAVATERVLTARRVKSFVTCSRSTAPDDIAVIATKHVASRTRP
jgi:CheY-like chemotaxis protein